MHTRSILFFMLILALTLTACTTTPAIPTPTVTLEPTSSTTPKPTASPTVTSSPTLTPTPSYPVSAGTPFPTSLLEITVENAIDLQELARYGGEHDVVWAEIEMNARDSVLDTNHGVITPTNTFPPSETYCYLFNGLKRDPKVFLGDNNKIAIVTIDGLQIYSQDSGDLLHSLSIRASTLAQRCPTEIHNVRVSPDMQLAASYYEGSIDIYSINTGEIITSLKDMKTPRIFSPNSGYLVVENKNSQFVVYQTSDWGKVLTISSVSSFDKVGISDDNQYVVFFPEHGTTAMAYNLNDDTRIELSADCESGFYCMKEYHYQLRKKGINVLLDPERFIRSAPYFAEAEYYFSDDGMSLITSRPIDPATENINYPSLIKEVCFEKESGKKVVCATQPQDGWLNFEADESLRIGTTSLWKEPFDFEPSSGRYSMVLDQNNGDWLKVAFYPKYRFAFTNTSHVSSNFYPRETCTLPFDGASTCTQTMAQIFPNTLQSYTLLAISDTQTDIILGIEDNASLLTSVQHQSSDETFNPVFPWIRMTPDQKKLIYPILSGRSMNALTTVQVLDIASGRTVESLRTPYILAPFISANSHYAGYIRHSNLNSNSRGITLIDLETGRKIFNKNINTSSALAFSIDSRLMVYVERDDQSSGQIIFYSIEKKTIEQQFDVDIPTFISTLALSPSGNILAIGFTDGIIQLFDTQNGKEIRSWRAHNGQVKNLDFSPNNQMLLSVGFMDQYAKIWGVLP